MKTIKFLAATLLVLTASCSSPEDYASYVNPFIGTGGHGHTFPGAAVPDGMVQVSPDTRVMGWDACSGYHYSDSVILGFSHTHLSGTGIGDYGDILIMPLAAPTSSGERPSRFSHDEETASPGYYSVFLQDEGIKAELTATARAAIHRYTYPESDQAAIILDLAHTLQRHHNSEMQLDIHGDRAVSGLKRTKGWAADQPVFFYAEFSKPVELQLYQGENRLEGTSACGTGLSAKARFQTSAGEEVLVRIGISSVDVEGARNNLQTEVTDWDFDSYVKAARKAWNCKLSLVDVETNNENDKVIFYTSLYHALLPPYLFSDADGRYRGQDLQIHQSESDYYTVFSLWDTFRALHPLLSIIEPEQNRRYVHTLLQKYREGGVLPKWDLASNYTGTMIGSHAVSVIAESYLKGEIDTEAEAALEACIASMDYQRDFPLRHQLPHIGEVVPEALQYKDSLTFIPRDKVNESVAQALEFAYNDWCIARFADKLGKTDICDKYLEKSTYYKKYFDASTGFMRGRNLDGSWAEPFDPRSSNHRMDDYCEGNAWQWTWFVPHDLDGLCELFGGRGPFLSKLDSLFTISSEMTGPAVSSDISGLVGQYAHGNEPSHHIAHIYNYMGEAYKTQALVDHILKTLYVNDPNGLAGNEDCGQMSAWYILNAIGFYPIAPASCEYSFGRPLFDEVTIRPEQGKEIHITVHDNGPENKYIRELKVNGVVRDRLFISHEELVAGAEIDIWMSAIHK